LPAPEAPTIAVILPAAAVKLRFLQHRHFLNIAEGHVVEAYRAGGEMCLGGAWRVALLRLAVEQLVDHARIDQRPLHADLHARPTPGRVIGQISAVMNENTAPGGWPSTSAR